MPLEPHKRIPLHDHSDFNSGGRIDGGSVVAAIGGLPTSGTTSTTSGTEGSDNGMVPFFIASGDTFTVPENKQALFAMTIDVEGTLTVDGYLVEVS